MGDNTREASKDKKFALQQGKELFFSSFYNGRFRDSWSVCKNCLHFHHQHILWCCHLHQHCGMSCKVVTSNSPCHGKPLPGNISPGQGHAGTSCRDQCYGGSNCLVS